MANYKITTFISLLFICNTFGSKEDDKKAMEALQTHCSDGENAYVCDGLLSDDIDLICKMGGNLRGGYKLILKNSNITSLPKNFFLKFSTYHDIWLDNCNLEQLKQDDFIKIKFLKELSMPRNKIESLQNKLFTHIPKLQVLSFSSNKLKYMESDTFDGLSKLTKLILSKNEIEKLPENIFDPLISIETINLADNELKVLNENLFEYNTNLKVLDLNRNELIIVDKHIIRSPYALEIFKTAVDSGQDFTSTSFLQNLNNMERLYLSDNYFGYISNNTFAHMTRLIKLILSNSNVSTIEPDAFDNQFDLGVLALSNNNLRELDVETFVNLKNLKFFYIDHNELDKFDFFKLIENTKVQHIGLGSNMWNCDEIQITIGLLKSRKVELKKLYQDKMIIDENPSENCGKTIRTQEIIATTDSEVVSETVKRVKDFVQGIERNLAPSEKTPALPDRHSDNETESPDKSTAYAKQLTWKPLILLANICAMAVTLIF